MKSVYMTQPDTEAPLDALRVGDLPLPEHREGWTTVQVQAASLNHHDVWSLRGVGISTARLPLILGCDAAGVDDSGREVLVYPVIDDGATRSVLSERYHGAFAEYVSVPRENLVAIPEGMTISEAACMPTAWLTAYKMLFTRAQIEAGDLVLVQGASGGLSTALVMLASAAGARVWVTGRSAAARAFAVAVGAVATFETGARLPERVDHVMDSVGAVTWNHSLKSLKAGGTMVVPGATSGYEATINIALIFAKQLSILGTSMGSLSELTALLQFCVEHDLHPPIGQSFPLSDAVEAFRALQDGPTSGKILLIPSA
ncbi:NADPH:quinone reductase-like Zn-dependent oxidoreductase [Rhodococcus erythropolis]|uniref:zinc-binding dehydrogenase n=2 Tax=Rhodococcus erythropolis TaxID=1833 RepID=UPI0022258BB5|nr:zinc-binding dehydrogenase [Rhodococcus erythropolis]MCS4256004.1 NADPH:quinone reductase-like Zn-dependent oxidoreductase [Rhodococcus erythropolis]